MFSRVLVTNFGTWSIFFLPTFGIALDTSVSITSSPSCLVGDLEDLMISSYHTSITISVLFYHVVTDGTRLIYKFLY